jgi:hypothetical protein
VDSFHNITQTWNIAIKKWNSDQSELKRFN